eukprot:1344198-Amphidinium_carterae.1
MSSASRPIDKLLGALEPQGREHKAADDVPVMSCAQRQQLKNKDCIDQVVTAEKKILHTNTVQKLSNKNKKKNI